MAVKLNDYVEIEYTGKVIETKMVFDTTDETVAKESGLDRPNANYGPAIIKVGDGQLLPGLDEALVGKDVGERFEITVPAEKGFGKKTASLVQLINTNKFRKENINPVPGLQVTVDDQMGVIKSVTGGRTLVDFNHPLAGQDLLYEVRVLRIIEDDAEKVKAVLERMAIDADVDCKEGTATLSLKKELPEEFKKILGESLKKAVETVKNVEFKQ